MTDQYLQHLKKQANFTVLSLPLIACGILTTQVSATPLLPPDDFPTTRSSESHSATSATDSVDLNGFPFLRSVETSDRELRLEVAARTFAHPDDDRPTVTLVGVAHIGDSALYQQLQTLLDEHDVVLFESVMPEGASTYTGDSASAKIDATNAGILFIGGLLTYYESENGRFPPTIDTLATFVTRSDSRMNSWIDRAMTDAWEHQLQYTVDEPGDAFTLKSFGSDGEPGGEEAAADLTFAALTPPQNNFASAGDNLQSDLAEALNLEFQIDAINYNRPNWIGSDMTASQLRDAFAKKDLNFDVLGDSLAGSSLPAQFVKAILKIIEFADVLFEGRLADGVKVGLIEILSNEELTHRSLDQMGEGFKEILVNQRNAVVIDDLRQVIAERPNVETIAIFYGAAHMKDFARRLVHDLGYKPIDEQWLPAITVDLRTLNMSTAQLKQLRQMLRQSMP